MFNDDTKRAPRCLSAPTLGQSRSAPVTPAGSPSRPKNKADLKAQMLAKFKKRAQQASTQSAQMPAAPAATPATLAPPMVPRMPMRSLSDTDLSRLSDANQAVGMAATHLIQQTEADLREMQQVHQYWAQELAKERAQTLSLTQTVDPALEDGDEDEDLSFTLGTNNNPGLSHS